MNRWYYNTKFLKISSNNIFDSQTTPDFLKILKRKLKD
jgi:hypothetical protein